MSIIKDKGFVIYLWTKWNSFYSYPICNPIEKVLNFAWSSLNINFFLYLTDNRYCNNFLKCANNIWHERELQFVSLKRSIQGLHCYLAVIEIQAQSLFQSRGFFDPLKTINIWTQRLETLNGFKERLFI